MLSNDVGARPGESCEALLLTAKARVIAPMTVLRRGRDDFLLSRSRSWVSALAARARRYRFAAKVQIEPEQHSRRSSSAPTRPPGRAVGDYGEPADEVLDAGRAGAEPIGRGRARAAADPGRHATLGREIDDRVLPAEAGLDERAISFTKGCYPGQEPVARLHYRGHANRRLRVLGSTALSRPRTTRS